MIYLKKKDFPNPKFDEILSKSILDAELEIGVGTGVFFCKIASFQKDKLFLGVEYKSHSSNLAAARLKFKKIKNAIVINMEAFELMQKWLNDNTFQTIHIYFPTPRPELIGLPPNRLIEPNFVKEAFRILKPLGSIRIVTDRKDYFDEATSLFNEKNWWMIEWQPIEAGQKAGYLLGSPHENKFRKEGRIIYKAQFLCIKKEKLL